MAQLWMFWVAPLAGGLIGGFVYKLIGADAVAKPEVTGAPN